MNFLKNKVFVFLAIFIVVIVIAGLMLGGMYNSLVQKEVSATNAWAQVENVLQRRADLIPNLVSTAKGYMKHEKEIFENLARARAAYSGAATVGDKMRAATQMGGALSRLLVIVENYPNLKANQTFNRLMDELAGSENRIAVERRRFNETVRSYNTSIRSVPQNLIAGYLGFGPKEFFEAEEGKKEVPKVEF